MIIKTEETNLKTQFTLYNMQINLKKITGIFGGDRILWFVVGILSVFSLLAVYSSTGTLAFRYKGGNTEYYLMKHFTLLAMGLGLMLIAHKIKYTYYSRFSQIIYIISLPLLLYTLLFGTNLNDASRWYTLPIINISFQPSDLAKLALMLFLARLLAKRQDTIKDFRKTFLPAIGSILLITGLILPANFSTATILFLSSIGLLFMARVNSKHLLAMMGIGAVALGIFLTIAYYNPHISRFGTWKNRVENFVNSDEGESYQVDQAKIAIATGGLIGKMPGNSTQRNFIPHPYSDFIYAIIIEEFGILGGMFVALLYLVLLFRAIKIARASESKYGAFLTLGLAFSLVFQAMINMAVAVNLVPVTGQPLPLISMGGTSLWFTSIAIGIILSVSRYNEKERKEAPVETAA